MPSPHAATGRSRHSIDAELGEGHHEQILLAPGLQLLHSHFRLHAQTHEVHEIHHPAPALMMAWTLQGQARTRDVDGERFEFLPGHGTVASFTRAQGERVVPGGQWVRQLRLVLAEPVVIAYGLQSLLPVQGVHARPRTLFRGRNADGIQAQASRVAQLQAQQADPLDLHVAALQLLGMQLRQLDVRAVPRGSAVDESLAWRAQELLCAHLDRAVELPWLASTLGATPASVQRALRAVHGCSAHQFLQRLRMEQALALLQEGVPVSVVGYRVGYAHVSSFSAAFSRFHGRPPTAYGGRRPLP